MQPADFCRELEAYLCRKNDGHLIRVTGPSFDLVSGWAERGVPLKVAFAGIDRYFNRYYRKGPRRRPVRIDFCEADILDVFDEWRRATGTHQSSVGSHRSPLDEARGDPEALEGSPVAGRQSRTPRGRSLPDHLERVLLRLTAARVDGRLDARLDDLIDRVSRELDAARRDPRGLRGDARRQLVDRLAHLDRELLTHVRATLDDAVSAEMSREAEEELAPFRAGMAADAFAHAREAALDRLVRQRAQLPTIAFST